VSPTQTERSAATRAKLIGAARDLFAERGYAGVGTDEVVKRARVTRGALYHHFREKEDLFRAVHEQVEEELSDSIQRALAGQSGAGPMELLHAGVAAFLEHCTDPAFARIALVEAPAIIGWIDWRAVDERHGLGLIMAGLQAAMAIGAIPEQPVKPLAHLLLAAIGEAGMIVAAASEGRQARARVEPALTALIDGLALKR
jgi:AcrR family transcriptional regulator